MGRGDIQAVAFVDVVSDARGAAEPMGTAALTAPKGWDNLGISWRQFCFSQLTTDLSRDPG